jgi:hypothetical protein
MTFMSGRILQQNMPREMFRTVQTKMFPSYLRFLTAGEGVLTFLYTFMRSSSKWQILNLLILVGATAYNAYVLEPQTTKVIFVIKYFFWNKRGLASLHLREILKMGTGF